jgi:hypothetical protein
MTLRERLGSWLLRERAAPISFTPEYQSAYFGHGIATNQAPTDTLLRENIGVPDMATRAIANRIASLNPQVKISRRTSQGTMEDEVLDDHVLKILLDRPHPTFTKQQTLRLIAQWIVTVGEAYLLKVRNRLALPAMLQPMPPQNTEPIIRQGEIEAFSVKDGKGAVHRIEASEVIHFWFPDPETLYTAEGYLGPNAVVTDAQRFASEHLRSRYQNDATPPLILKAGGDAAAPNDPQWERWQADYKRKYNQRAGTHVGLPAMLPTGWDAILVAMSSGADITPLLEHWQANQLMNFGTPASVLGRVISGDRSSAETNQYVFDRHTIVPIAMLISEALTLQLAEEFDESIFVEFEDFVSEDKEHTLKQEDQDLRLKVRTTQQVLRDRGADPEDATWGEYPVGTLADTPYTGEEIELPLPKDDQTALEEPEDEPEEEPRQRSYSRADYFSPKAVAKRSGNRERKYRPKTERALRGIFEAQRKETIKKLREFEPRARATIDADAIFDIDDEAWAKMFKLKVDPLRRAILAEAGADALLGIGLGQTFEFTPTVTKALEEHGARLVTHANTTTLKKLTKALVKANEEGGGVSAAEKYINEVFAGRRRNARTIARTELGRGQVQGTLEGYKQSGVTERKQWLDNRDPEVRDSHVGSLIPIVGINEKFTLPSGYTCDGPLDPTLPVGEVANCRCDVLPVFDNE